ncbi:helitron_like_N domain-containing protein [Trichonephila clavipes]|nr:helitron_like_N domain-containing protein [Trichonephila clavipes]
MMQGRISESAEDHEERPECQREMSHILQKWLFGMKENAAYSYNPSIDYKSDASCTLGPMSITCQFCSAMKFKETLHVHKVDDFISAEIPNPEENPDLFSCITTQMIHGPCGVINPFSPCMKDGRCTKRYPRDFLKETQTVKDGYPLYHRRKP